MTVRCRLEYYTIGIRDNEPGRFVSPDERIADPWKVTGAVLYVAEESEYAGKLITVRTNGVEAFSDLQSGFEITVPVSAIGKCDFAHFINELEPQPARRSEAEDEEIRRRIRLRPRNAPPTRVETVCQMFCYVGFASGQQPGDVFYHPARAVGSSQPYGMIFVITQPPEHAGKAFSMHHDGLQASGDAYKMYKPGKRYRMAVNAAEIGELRYHDCSCREREEVTEEPGM
ncbi:MAG TPA: hypothetical protein VGP72_07370 [Planctomycetota bacterium]